MDGARFAGGGPFQHFSPGSRGAGKNGIALIPLVLLLFWHEKGYTGAGTGRPAPGQRLILEVPRMMYTASKKEIVL